VVADQSFVFFETATLSEAAWHWLRCGTANELSGVRVDLLVRSVLMAMRDEGWNPHSAQGRGRPLRFDILLGEDSVSVEVSVNLEGTDLLYIDVFCWANN
jgi:hypothetical protein